MLAKSRWFGRWRVKRFYRLPQSINATLQTWYYPRLLNEASCRMLNSDIIKAIYNTDYNQDVVSRDFRYRPGTPY